MDIGETFARMVGGAIGSLVPAVIFLLVVRLVFKPYSRLRAVFFAALSGIVVYLIFSINSDFVLEKVITAFIVFLIIAIFGKVEPKINFYDPRVPKGSAPESSSEHRGQ
jgi:hypothetical protein